MKYSELLFDGGIGEVKRRLAWKVKSSIRKSGVCYSEVDRMLDFGVYSPEGRPTPSCKEVIDDPTKITGLNLVRLECLELDLDNTLELEMRIEERMTPEQIKEISDTHIPPWKNGELSEAERLSILCFTAKMRIRSEILNENI